jgi:hypothetical protein
MLIAWQALAFTVCALFSLVPSAEVQCDFSVPVAAISPAPLPVEPRPASLVDLAAPRGVALVCAPPADASDMTRAR